MMKFRIECIALLIAITGCSGSEAPKIPLGAASSAAAVPADSGGPIHGEAKVALDRGNALFREKDYKDALEQYRRSAELAPRELAPLLGIMMVADVTKDSALAKETLPRIRKLDPAMADSSLVTPHSKIIKQHPTVRPGRTWRSPKKYFCNLSQPEYGARRTQTQNPVTSGETRRPEGFLQRVELQHENLKQQRKSDCRPQQPVREHTGKCASKVGAGVEHIEQLRQRERCERHSLRVAQVTVSLEEPAG
jgi:alkanesulfonate monooxygenase SsuD/methylene tetrahydromethanopterin reductase-like flavin-dependent oxidoreductase (luciferase family)